MNTSGSTQWEVNKSGVWSGGRGQDGCTGARQEVAAVKPVTQAVPQDQMPPAWHECGLISP